MTTRADLRRSIGARMSQPFFRRFGGSAGTTTATGTTTTLVDTNRLRDVDNYWRGSFVYLPETDEVREITASTNGQLTWLAPVGAAVAVSKSYEIWDQVTPYEVHAAINRALGLAWPDFFTVGSDETLVIRDNIGLHYTLPVTMRRLCQVHLTLYPSKAGAVTSTGTNVQVIDSGASFTSADAGKYVSIYDDGSTADGDIRLISTVDSATQITVSTAFTQILPVGAKYRILDKGDPYPTVLLLQGWIANAEDSPTEIWLGQHIGGYEGYPLYLSYEAEFTTLATEAATTTCPDEYIVQEAMAYLYTLKLGASPAIEIPNWEAQAKLHSEMAERYRRAHAMRHSPSTMLSHGSTGYGYPASDYPFS